MLPDSFAANLRGRSAAVTAQGERPGEMAAGLAQSGTEK